MKRILALALAGALLAGCGSSSSSAPTASPGGSVLPSAAITEVPIDPTPYAAGTHGAYGLATEPAMLGLFRVPAGLSLVESVDLEQPALNDADLAKSATGFAAALAGHLVDTNWATVSLIHLKPTADTEDFYASWRNQYDAAACSQAGGVASTDTLSLGGRTVDHAVCAGELDLYHVRLAARHVIVSASSLGPLHYGEQLMAGLAP